MELLVFVLCVCAITMACALVCLREMASVRKLSREQRQAEFLIGAVERMAAFSSRECGFRYEGEAGGTQHS
jgi:hypothetical protein